MMRKLPDAEFDIMKVVWANEPPVTSNVIMQQLGNARGWKAQSAISLMLRLVERGFLRTEKNGKERTYFPLINKKDYLKFETDNFVGQFHDNSFLNLVATMYGDKPMSDDDIEELLNWAKGKRG